MAEGGFLKGFVIGAAIEIVLGLVVGGVFHKISQQKLSAAAGSPSLRYYYG